MTARATPHPAANPASSGPDASANAARADAERVARSPVERMVERFVERVGGQAHARAVFGDAVTQAGVTVIPVTRVFGGFGGGSGPDDSEHGVGAGGGFAALPIGFIEIKAGSAHFRAIDPIFGNLGVYGLVARAVGGLAVLAAEKLSRRKKRA